MLELVKPNTNVQVLVFKCMPTADHIFSDERIYEHTFTTLGDALMIAATKCRSGACVIVRLCYNERDAKGKYFREWRSWNGQSFKQVRWNTGN